MRVLVPAWLADTGQYIVFDEVNQCVGNGGAVVMESAACQFGVYFVEAFGFSEPVFFPEFLYDASAGFSSGQRCRAFGLGSGDVF